MSCQLSYVHLLTQLCASADSREQTCRYQQFTAALEKLDSKLASKSSLPTVYQWERPMSGPTMRCAACKLASGRA